MPSKYKKWIKEEVVYIITPKEKEVFYKLEADKDRDQFKEEFWRHRDPTPSTPKNEFKEEHYRRIEYANKKFGRSTPAKGWRTDRGRIYIALGDPMDIQKFSSRDTHPIEIWYYQDNSKFGQTPFFRILFFQRQGVGEFELYSPIADGPKSLVPTHDTSLTPILRRDLDMNESYKKQQQEALFDTNLDWRDRAAYKVLKESVSFELAEASWSSFPGRDGPEYRLPSVILIDEVKTHPQKKVQDDYAYEFLEHGAIVDVSYSVKYINNLSRIQVLQDESGLFFVNYSVEPEKLSVDYYQDKYFTNVKISVRVTDLEGKTIFQRARNFPVELKKKQLEKIGQRPFHLYDSFPLIPGNYKLSLLLENTVTKEFTSVDRHISVPEPESLLMSSLILTSKVKKDSPYRELNKAFQIGNLELYPSLRKQFFKKDKLFIFFQIYGVNKELEEKGILKFNFYKGEQKFHILSKKVDEYRNKRDFLQEIPLERFPLGICKVKVSISGGEGEEILSEIEEFSVSSAPIRDSWIAAQTNPPVDNPIYSFIVGNQFINNGEIRKARDELERAYERKSDSLGYALSYARALLILKEYQKTREILFPFIKAGNENFTFYYYLGKATQEEGMLEEAISYYQKALSHKGNVIEILNSIGECYFKLGDNKQALRAWQKSLEINPDQERIRKKVEVIKEKKQREGPLE